MGNNSTFSAKLKNTGTCAAVFYISSSPTQTPIQIQGEGEREGESEVIVTPNHVRTVLQIECTMHPLPFILQDR